MPKKQLTGNKMKDLVSISFLLAITLFIHFILCLDSKAENVEVLQLNKNITKQNNIRFEKVGIPLECVGQVCFKRPNDIAVASDGSFILVVDSGNSSDSNIYLRKINPPFDQSSKSEFIPLIQSSTDVPLLTIILSQNNKKAAVYREPIETETTLVQIIDLKNNSVKELMSVTSKGLQIGAPVFLDPEGSKFLASTLDPNSPELVIIDSVTDEIVNKVPLPDIAQSIHISPSFKKAIITYRNIFAQSVSIYDLQTNTLSRLDIDPSLSFSIDDFLGRVDFDLSGNRALISSLGGAHVLHFLDIGNNKLKSVLLDKNSEGPALGEITPDGMTAFAIGSLLDFTTGFKIYKLSLSNDGSISLINSAIVDDGGIVLDVAITPDQSKVLVLALKEDKKQLKILSTKDLSKISELTVANNNAQSFLLVDPNGRFAVTPNTNIEASISIITDFNSGPIFKSIIPNIASVNVDTPFTINGFIDLSRFSEDVKVCFRNNDFCTTSTKVSNNGQTITGITPKFPSAGFEDLILNTKSSLGNLIRSTKYEGIFQFKKEATIADTFAPEITIFAPTDSVLFNTRRILVFGRVDGTGSLVDSVQVNDQKAILNTEGQISPNIVNFISDLRFKSDGNFQITVNAKDKANNTSEKSVKIAIDTLIPQITANIEPTANIGVFKVTGSVNGTGSNVASITVNSAPVTFAEGEVTNFTIDTNVLPVVITVTDRAGNKNTLNISNPLLEDKLPPTITTISPTNGQIFTDQANISTSFTVTDNTSIKEVTFNGIVITAISGNQFSQNITLKPGENSISITATDINNNKSAITIKITYIPSQITEIPTTKPQGVSVKDLPGEKEVITIPSDFENLNETLIDQFTQISANVGKLVDISSTLSVEISNPPPIPEGALASIEVPKVEGLLPTTSEESPEIPKGFSFATNVALSNNAGGNIVISNEDLDKQNAAVLVDSTGRTFVVGFAFFKGLENNTVSRNLNRKYKFQTTGGQPLDLITTFTVPGDAIEGDATVSILSKNESIATIPLKISPSKEVKVGKRILAKPQINEPIIATVKKSGTELILKIKGRNFIGRIATIDGALQRLIGKAKFFTNVTFVPSEGITIKEFKVVSRKKIILKALIESNIKPGVKLFNVITPKGADIGGIVFVDPIVNGDLETTSSPVSLILESP